MSGLTGQAQGYLAKLYKAAVIGTKDESNLAAACIGGNEVVSTKDIGSGVSKSRNIIDVPVFGQDTAGKLPGQVDPGTFDFTVAFEGDNSVHTAIRDDAGTTQYTFIVEFTQGSNVTYVAMDGYIADATVNFSVDSEITMDCSVARSGGATWVDKA